MGRDFQILVSFILALSACACSSSQGQPVEGAALGYTSCSGYYSCGAGRFCSQASTCWSECRDAADCSLVKDDPRASLCNLFGQCVVPGSPGPCTSHGDCGAQGLCNGRCSTSQAACGTADECPFENETCQGECAAWCRTQDDCAGGDPDTGCTPVGLCLLPGWERWISPGEIPPASCTRDDQCTALGFGFRCESDTAGTCIPSQDPTDLGDGEMAGVWGMRLNLAVVTFGLPLLSRQTTNSSHLTLVRARQQGDGPIELTEKICSIEMINFSDTEREASDLIHVTIPHRFLQAMPLTTREGTLTADEFSASTSLELRGCMLEDPARDPMPTRLDYEANPEDPRLWDQDGDGHVGLTTLTDGVLRGEIYIVQRLRLSLAGQRIDDERLQGLVSAQTEELIMSSSKPALIYDIDTAIHDDAQRTYFRLQRLSHEASCTDLIRASQEPGAWLAHKDRLDDDGLD